MQSPHNEEKISPNAEAPAPTGGSRGLNARAAAAAARLRALPWRDYAQRGGWIALIAFGALLALLAVYLTVLNRSTPSTEELRQIRVAQPSNVYSADGELLFSFRRAQQQQVTLDRVSPYVLHALIATEDHRFYDHRGVDISRTLSAVLHTATGDTQGGSTITQQLARNLFPEEIGRARNLNRKVKEIITALRIERLYSKPQILENYLNTAPFLYNVVGIEMAARTYFDKSAAELDALESATLIGMLKGTRYYNPVLHPERAQKRRNVVLAQMVKHGKLPEAQLQKLKTQPLQVRFNRPGDELGSAPHFAAHARKWLLEWADEHDYDVYADGLVIHTTLDSKLQGLATAAVTRQAQALQQVADVEWSHAQLRVASGSPDAYVKARARVDPFAFFWSKRRDLLTAFVRESPEFKKAVAGGASEESALQTLLADAQWLATLKQEKTRLEAGFSAIDPRSGEIKAWVGSRDFDIDQYDHVALAARQPGSTFKPIIYAAALELGFSPERSYVDGPVEVRMGDGSVWRPTDMAGASGLPLSLREGLIQSKNTITAQVMQDVGVARIVSLAQAMGVDQSKLDPVPSLALGTSPVTLLEMVSAYATIAHEGQHLTPVFVERITDRHGRVLAEFGATARRAMSADNAVDLIDMMRGVVTRGTGTAVKTRFGISADVAGKTGTTQNNTDGWFILMHPALVAGAWVGFNDARVTMRTDHWGQGGHNAVLLVGDFYRAAFKGKLLDAKLSFPPPLRPAPVVLPPVTPSDGWIDGEGSQGPPSDAAQRGDAGAPKSAAEIEQVLGGARDEPSVQRVPESPVPITRAPVSGGNDASGASSLMRGIIDAANANATASPVPAPAAPVPAGSAR